MPEPNGHHASTQSEIKLNADHAGLSLLQKPSQTDSALPLELMLFFPHKIWSHVTSPIWDVMVDTSHQSGQPSLLKVLSQMLACHTPLKTELLLHAPKNVLTDQPSTDTSASQDQLFTQPLLLLLKLKSTRTDQLKLLSQFTKTS